MDELNKVNSSSLWLVSQSRVQILILYSSFYSCFSQKYRDSFRFLKLVIYLYLYKYENKHVITSIIGTSNKRGSGMSWSFEKVTSHTVKKQKNFQSLGKLSSKKSCQIFLVTFIALAIVMEIINPSIFESEPWSLFRGPYERHFFLLIL